MPTRSDPPTKGPRPPNPRPRAPPARVHVHPRTSIRRLTHPDYDLFLGERPRPTRRSPKEAQMEPHDPPKKLHPEDEELLLFTILVGVGWLTTITIIVSFG